MPLLGIIEEAGELSEADCKRSLLGIADALADIMIFALDYCSGMGWDVGALWTMPSSTGPAGFAGILQFLGKLSHAHLKAAQGIRVNEDHVAEGQKALAGLFAWLRARDSGIVEKTEETWQKVRKRDWKADPAKAEPLAAKTPIEEIRLFVSGLRKQSEARGYSLFAVAADPLTNLGSSIYHNTLPKTHENAVYMARQAHVQWEKSHGIDPDHDWAKQPITTETHVEPSLAPPKQSEKSVVESQPPISLADLIALPRTEDVLEPAHDVERILTEPDDTSMEDFLGTLDLR
jgi:hypothetical protein